MMHVNLFLCSKLVSTEIIDNSLLLISADHKLYKFGAVCPYRLLVNISVSS